IGGVDDTIFRYIVSVLYMNNSFTTFTWTTFIVNITGAFLLTWIIFQPFFVRRLDPVIFVALTTGLLGSYTTFSTLILEATFLLHHQMITGVLYIGVTIFGGLLACFLGYIVAMKTNRNGAI